MDGVIGVIIISVLRTFIDGGFGVIIISVLRTLLGDRLF